jgi:D-lactate dehydrogenase (cytochrome)
MPDGSVVRTGGRARKSSTGYDLTRLLVGAEGTLGVITEVAVRLHGQPEAVSSAVCEFDSLEGAAQAPCPAPAPPPATSPQRATSRRPSSSWSI